MSQPRCLLKGALGHELRRVFVRFAGAEGIVSLCNESRTTEDSRGMERERHVAINAKSGRLIENIVNE